MESVLSEVGFAGAEGAFVNEDGEVELFDGHLRADIADDEEVPVLITDLTREEADKILATFDVLGMMAETDQAALSELAKELTFDSRDLEGMIDDMTRGLDEAVAAGQEKPELDSIPQMELQPDESYDYVIVLSRRRAD